LKTYKDPSVNLWDNSVSFTCITDTTNINNLNKDVNQYCIYLYEGKPNYRYLDSIKDKVFIVALVDLTLTNDIGHIPYKFSTNEYCIDLESSKKPLNNILTEYDKPSYLPKQDPVNKSNLKDWFDSNQRLLTSSKFDVYTFGSFLGRDIDLLVTKKEKVTIKDVSRFLRRLIKSGDSKGITIEPFYCNDINYFNTFYYEDSSIESKPVFLAWYATSDYPSVGKKRYKDNLCMMYTPWKRLFYESCHKDSVKKLITTYSELESMEGGVHIAPSIYYSLFNRFANLKKLV
jgi:hypothetical protein